ncbi:putative ribonuclease H-like domain-containing protein [Tanacetum coccineum]|uniref:Ribonuclease H-like domain-containing protein n=1 Tax=Tanacetum coccineum TaxID=301880 RepID=A0ABQ5GQG2_9ASTR
MKHLTFKSEPEPSSAAALHLLHRDLCGSMHNQSVNGKKYILVIVDDYSRFTWVHFLASKKKTPLAIVKFIKRVHGFAAALAILKPERLKVDKAQSGGGGSVDVVLVVTVKLEGTSADAVGALKKFVLCRVSTEI